MTKYQTRMESKMHLHHRDSDISYGEQVTHLNVNGSSGQYTGNEPNDGQQDITFHACEPCRPLLPILPQTSRYQDM